MTLKVYDIYPSVTNRNRKKLSWSDREYWTPTEAALMIVCITIFQWWILPRVRPVARVRRR
ncbi:hypothetical protein M501DRAFT_995206 [Patellaria atrata CBS 101060]|uniref:Uncharacterized protein n=1 Tax=Patellaria atrata CBS 101060 TaxID=1346257 RepID=A0A9P4SAB0_9PEZI|nr:hypothetical protein M501DRAFT_995206 [Patellaria atrata CBS 101060]